MPLRATVVLYSTSRGERVGFAPLFSYATALAATATSGAICAKTSLIGSGSTLIIEGTGELRRPATRVG
jgi:hypothetical protein